MVAEITEEPVVSKTFNRGEDTLEAPGFTPWFDAYMKLYLQSIPALVRILDILLLYRTSSFCTHERTP